jgi:hypothetical protein
MIGTECRKKEYGISDKSHNLTSSSQKSTKDNFIVSIHQKFSDKKHKSKQQKKSGMMQT